MSENIKIAGMSESLRKSSYNTFLLQATGRLLPVNRREAFVIQAQNEFAAEGSLINEGSTGVIVHQTRALKNPVPQQRSIKNFFV
jgi:hypothetical protein